MQETKAKYQSITQIILKVFQLNGSFIEFGDKLTQEFGLTASRWQVMGVISEAPATASEIARIRGIKRQSVQPIVHSLVQDGMVHYYDNPHHKKSKLIGLSIKGKKKFDQIMIKYENLVKKISDNIEQEVLNHTITGLSKIEKLYFEDLT